MCACKHSLPGRWHGRTPLDDDDDDQSCPVAAAEEATLAMPRRRVARDPGPDDTARESPLHASHGEPPPVPSLGEARRAHSRPGQPPHVERGDPPRSRTAGQVWAWVAGSPTAKTAEASESST